MNCEQDILDKMAIRADIMIGKNLSRLSKKFIKRAILSHNLSVKPFFWHNGVLSWSLSQTNIQASFNNKLLSKTPHLKLVDDALFYYANYERMSMATIDSAINSSLSLRRNNKGSILYRPGDANIFIDALGMIPQFLVRYGVTNGSPEITEFGIAQFDIFMESALDNPTGLPYHGYNSISGMKMGIIGWGRSLGWILIGLSECLQWLDVDSEEFKKLEKYFIELLEATMKYQSQSGGFSWQVQAVDGPEDTSATSMIGYALVRYNQKKLSSLYSGPLEKMSGFITSNVRDDGSVINSSAECRGLSMYPQIFENNSWGQGFSLLFLNALKDKVL